MSSAAPAVNPTKSQKKRKGKKPAEGTATPNGEPQLSAIEVAPVAVQGEAGEAAGDKKDNEALKEIIK